MRMRTRYFGAFGTSASLHLALAMLIAWSTARAAGQALAAEDRREPLVSLVSPRDLDSASAAASSAATRVPESSRAPDSLPEALPAAPTTLGIRLEPADMTLKFPAFSFDFTKVVQRASTLFPFLTRDFTRDPLARVPSPHRAEGPLLNPFGPVARARQPLLLDDGAMQAMIDESWSRRQRWSAFQTIAAVAGNYSANEGRLPELLRQYVVQNGLQPYNDSFGRDPRLWAQLGLVADHTDFLDFVGRYAAAHPSSRATTELLFLVEKLAQASSDTLLTMLDIEPERDMLWTRQNHPAAFRAVLTIRSHYQMRLRELQLDEFEDVRARFAAVRIAILENILRTTPDGYRANDARFLIGAIHWQHQRYGDAMRAWRYLRIAPDDYYVEAIGELLGLLRESDGRLPDGARVRRMLEIEHGRWLGRAYDRLRHFGYHFDTF